MNTITVPVDKKMRDVPVLTIDHLRIFRQIENGANVAELVADERSRRIVDDLFALGWVTTSAERH
jgi:hypothetical protein